MIWIDGKVEPYYIDNTIEIEMELTYSDGSIRKFKGNKTRWEKALGEIPRVEILGSTIRLYYSDNVNICEDVIEVGRA